MKALVRGQMAGEETREQGETVAIQKWAEKGLLHSSEMCKEQKSSNLSQDCNSFEMYQWNHSSYPLKLMIRRTKEKRPNCCTVLSPGHFQEQNSPGAGCIFFLTHTIIMYVLSDFIILTITIAITFTETALECRCATYGWLCICVNSFNSKEEKNRQDLEVFVAFTF